MVRVAVDQIAIVRHDADVPAPEHEVAALEPGEVTRIDRGPELAFLHVAVARTGDPCRRQRHLYQPRAVEGRALLASPQVGRPEQAFRGGDRAGGELAEGR